MYLGEKTDFALEEALTQLIFLTQHAILFGIADQFITDDDLVVLLLFGLKDVILCVFFAETFHGSSWESREGLISMALRGVVGTSLFRDRVLLMLADVLSAGLVALPHH